MRGFFVGTAIVASFLSTPASAQAAFNVSVAMGGGNQNSGPALSVRLVNTTGVAVEPDGSLLVIDGERILRRDTATGMVTVIAGDPDPDATGAFAGDGGPANMARLNGPRGMAVDVAGTIYFADQGNLRVRRIDKATGIIDTVAGNGSQGFSGDGGPATAAQLGFPRAVAIDSMGGLLIADAGNNRIRRVDLTTGDITTYAGGGVSSANDIPATTASLCYPSDVLAAADGYVYISDQSCGRIQRVEVGSGLLSRYLNSSGTSGTTGDGLSAADSRLKNPGGLAMDADGNLVIVETDNYRVRRVNKTTTVVTTIAGDISGAAGSMLGASMPAVDLFLDFPRSVAADSSGNIYLAGGNNDRAYRLSPANFGLTRVTSQKTHSYSGGFSFSDRSYTGFSDLGVDRMADILGAVTVDPRIAQSGHALKFRFNAYVAAFSGVTVLDHLMAPIAGVITSTQGNEITLRLPATPDKRRSKIKLSGVNGGPDVLVSVGHLIGDVNGDGVVDALDVSAVKLRSGQRASGATAIYDIGLDAYVTAADIAAIKARIGNRLP